MNGEATTVDSYAIFDPTSTLTSVWAYDVMAKASRLLLCLWLNIVFRHIGCTTYRTLRLVPGHI